MRGGSATSGPDGPSGTQPTAPGTRRVALGLAAASLLGMLVLGAARLLRDGSLWLDEASIAANLLSLGLFELFGPYPTGHSFPRLYLFLIALLERGLGYETLVLRALPFAAFVAGACAWQRLTYQRFRGRPLLLALVIALNFIPASWFAYGAMLKQYSLDVALGLIPFLLGDAFYVRVLLGDAGSSRASARPVRRWPGLLLLLPLLFSFTYVIALLGRFVGFVAGRWLAERQTLPARQLGVAAGAMGAGVLALWLIDMRHTAGSDALFRFWQKCIPGDDWTRTPEIIWGFITGWYRVTPFGAREPLAEPLIIALALCLPLGAYAVVRRAAAHAARAGDDVAWGTRSLGCLAVVLGLLAASFLVDYPLCSGRLTLFALFSLQMLTAEGLLAASEGIAHRTGTRALGALLLGALLVCLLPGAYRSAHFLLTADTPENVRPLLPIIETVPERVVVVAACSTRQVATLPEWLDDPSIQYYEERVAAGLPGWPDDAPYWALSAGSGFYCPWTIREMERGAERIVPHHGPANTAALYEVHPRGAADR